jgi:hypothetical protein
MWIGTCSHKVLCGWMFREILVEMFRYDGKRCDGNEAGCLAWEEDCIMYVAGSIKCGCLKRVIKLV